MNLDNIKIGQKIKNYKELCHILQEPIKTGKSKILQLKYFGRFIKYEKKGNSYIINEIYNITNEKLDLRINGNNSVYGEHIQLLILNLLAQPENNGQVCLSCNALLQTLSMINNNYAFCKNKAPLLSMLINVPIFNIYDFYNHTQSTVKNALHSALTQLEKKSLIYCSKVLTVCVEDTSFNGKVNKTYRNATDKEIQFILKTEREIMDYFKVENKQEIVKRGLWDKFTSEITAELYGNSNILYYYNSYNIINNKEHILKALENMESKRLKNELNQTIKDKLEENTLKRHVEACSFIKKSIAHTTEKMSDTYITHNKKLIETLIDPEAKDMITEINKQCSNTEGQ